MAAYRQHQTIQHSFGRVALFRLSCFLIFFFSNFEMVFYSTRLTMVCVRGRKNEYRFQRMLTDADILIVFVSHLVHYTMLQHT